MEIKDIAVILETFVNMSKFSKYSKIYDAENPEFWISEMYYDEDKDKFFVKFEQERVCQRQKLLRQRWIGKMLKM